MRKIAIIFSESSGGVKTIKDKLIEGLSRDGFHILQVNIYGKKRIIRTLKDLKNIKNLRYFDAAIYMGSIPYPSSWIIKSATKVLVFVHGFIIQELISGLNDPYVSLGTKIKSFYLLQSWNFNRILGRENFYICHSFTTCEMNKICNNFILLPQFIFPEEVNQYARFRNYEGINKTIKILAYTPSHVRSPRLLSQMDLMKLIYCVSRNIKNKEVELTILDPSRVGGGEERFGNLVVRYLGFLPRNDFLQLLANSDLYIESCIDEELRLGSIEAALLGTPIAKLTHPKYVERQDYDEELIWASTFRDLVKAISDYLNDVDCWKPMYSERLREFIVNKRSWDKVKEPLVRILRE